MFVFFALSSVLAQADLKRRTEIARPRPARGDGRHPAHDRRPVTSTKGRPRRPCSTRFSRRRPSISSPCSTSTGASWPGTPASKAICPISLSGGPGRRGRDHRLAGRQDLQRAVRIGDQGRPPVPSLPRLRPDRHGGDAGPRRGGPRSLLVRAHPRWPARSSSGASTPSSPATWSRPARPRPERQEKERFREISAFTSGVAHEIKNPLNSLALLFELLDRRASPDMKGDLNLGKAQVGAIARIVDRFSNVVKAVRPAGRGPRPRQRSGRGRRESLAAEVPGGGLARPDRAGSRRPAGRRPRPSGPGPAQRPEERRRGLARRPRSRPAAAGPGAGSRSWSATTARASRPRRPSARLRALLHDEGEGHGHRPLPDAEGSSKPTAGRSRSAAGRAKAPNSGSSCRERDMNEPLILVVEDDPVQRQLIRENLEARGYPVVEASSRQEALEAVAPPARRRGRRRLQARRRDRHGGHPRHPRGRIRW
ncbi:MAG: hypothetical protein MZU79_05235 [Anaerotruncus sp.]|nr:hypothetical protein [Anaerotruncus sp.]